MADTDTREPVMIEHEGGFSHSQGLQCNLCPGYPHAGCLEVARRHIAAEIEACPRVIAHPYTDESGQSDCGFSSPRREDYVRIVLGESLDEVFGPEDNRRG